MSLRQSTVSGDRRIPGVGLPATIADARVLVIGGGPAGAACAIRLRQLGIAVALAERSPFPRFKVCGCCLGPAGIAGLASLGCDAPLRRAATPVRMWHGAFDGRGVRIPLRHGVIVSREVLDPLLLEQARDVGVSVLQPAAATVRAAGYDSVRVRLSFPAAGHSRPGTARTPAGDGMPVDAEVPIVVFASGLNGAGRWLPWVEPPRGPIGVAGRLAGRDGAEAGVVYMACDPLGYVGWVRTSDDQTVVAAAIRRRPGRGRDAPGGQRRDRSGVSAIRQTVWGMLQRSGLPRPVPEPSPVPESEADGGSGDWRDPRCVGDWSATGPLRRRRLAGRGRLLAIGDAAGYVEPFTGEGMTWGILAGIAAADRIAAGADREPEIGDLWAQELPRRMGARMRRCGRLSAALRSSWVRAAAGTFLGTFPRLSRPIIRQLERPL